MKRRHIDDGTQVRSDDLLDDDVGQWVDVRVGNVVGGNRVTDRGDVIGPNHVIKLATVVTWFLRGAGSAGVERTSSRFDQFVAGWSDEIAEGQAGKSGDPSGDREVIACLVGEVVCGGERVTGRCGSCSGYDIGIATGWGRLIFGWVADVELIVSGVDEVGKLDATGHRVGCDRDRRAIGLIDQVDRDGFGECHLAARAGVDAVTLGARAVKISEEARIDSGRKRGTWQLEHSDRRGNHCHHDENSEVPHS